MEILLILLGIGGCIINANEWFVIPQIIVNGLFIAGFVIAVIKVIIYLKAKHTINKHFNKFWD